MHCMKIDIYTPEPWSAITMEVYHWQARRGVPYESDSKKTPASWAFGNDSMVTRGVCGVLYSLGEKRIVDVHLILCRS